MRRWCAAPAWSRPVVLPALQMIPLRWTYAGHAEAGKRLASDPAFTLPTPSVVEQLRKSEKKQADFENLGAKLQARRQITRPAMQQAQTELRPLPTPSPGPSIPEAPPPAPPTNLRAPGARPTVRRRGGGPAPGAPGAATCGPRSLGKWNKPISSTRTRPSWWAAPGPSCKGAWRPGR